MPSGKTKFNSAWLSKLDNSGYSLAEWCKPDSSNCYSAYCLVCFKSISCSNTGVTQLIGHADGQKHRDAMKHRKDKTQKLLFQVPVPSTSISKQGGGDSENPKSFLQQFSVHDQVTKAETLWALQVASCGYSYKSCDSIGELFKAMFPGTISEQFSMSKSKVSYLISDGLGPYFRKEIAKQIQTSRCPYTIQFDETGNAQDKKQCDLLVRFWNERKGEISTLFLKSLMFGHARGETVSEAILETLSEEGYELPLKQLVSLGSDGPNVNKTIWRLINDHKKSIGLPGLTPFVPCTLHVVHNSFRKGLNSYGENAEQLAVDVFQWFKSHISQREDYGFTLEDLGLDEELFVRHVQCRWLTLVPSLERINNHWKALCKYFLTDLPQRSKADHTYSYLKKNTRYQRICQSLSGRECLAQIQFLVCVGPLFEPFLKEFQKQQPLIHLLYQETSNILKSVMLRFVKQDAIGNKSGRKLKNIDVDDSKNLLELHDMEIGADTEKTLSVLDSGKRKTQLYDIRKFYQAVAIYLQTRLPLNDDVIRSIQCLHPEVREQEKAQKLLRELCSVLPTIEDVEVSRVTDEWKLYRAEEIKEDEMFDKDGGLIRIDHYWSHVLRIKSASGELKYPHLRKVVQTGLCLPHGNADVERSLSINKKLLTPERSLLSEDSVNGLRLTRDAISMYKNISEIHISKDLLSHVRHAHKKYKERVEAEKSDALLLETKRKEAAKLQQMEKEQLEKQQHSKRKLDDKEREVKKNESELKIDLEKAKQIFDEANGRLAIAIKNKDFKEMNIAQGLLDVAKSNLDKVTVAMDRCMTERNDIGKKRMRMIDSFIKKTNKDNK